MLKKKPIGWLSLLLIFGLVATACSSDSKDTSNGDTTTTAAGGSGVDYSALSGSITGSGSSFTDAFLQEVIAEFSSASPLSVTYNATGSGTGKEQFGSELTDFGGTDSLVKEGDGPAPGSFLYVPTVAAPITVSYHLKGVDKLQLSADTLAGIFQADITKWNDTAIAADNPGVTLPNEAIVIAHRSDGSGTTSNFTKYLDKASDVWKLGAGDQIEWPTSSQAGAKNTGVAQLVKDNEGAIGYVDFSDAKASGLTFAAIKNKSGKYVVPSLAAASAALDGATVNDDLSYDPLDPDGADAYPITSPTFILVRTTYKDQQTLDNVVGFLTYVLTEGQALAEQVDYAKLPDSLRTKALAQLQKPAVG